MMNWFTALSETVMPVAEEIIEVEAIEASAVPNGLMNLPLFTKGLLTTAMGLAGVFLVLTLFFITIKLMQKIR